MNGEIMLNSAFSLVILIVLTVVLYSLVSIRRLRARQKQLSALHENLSVGNEVMFSGGLTGTVSGIEGDFVRNDIAKGVNLKVSRYAISEILRRF